MIYVETYYFTHVIFAKKFFNLYDHYVESEIALANIVIKRIGWYLVIVYFAVEDK